MFSSGSVWDYWSVFLHGLLLTLSIGTLSMIAGTAFGSAIGIARCYGPGWVKIICKIYTETFRSIPPLILFFGAFYGVSFAINFSWSPFEAAVLALTLEASALMSEVIRAAFQTVPQAQWEAAKSVGFRFPGALRRVIAPQAIRIATPPAINVFVAILKDSSLASVVGLVELTRAGMLVRETTGDSLTAFLVLAVTYFAINFFLSQSALWLERNKISPRIGLA